MIIFAATSVYNFITSRVHTTAGGRAEIPKNALGGAPFGVWFLKGCGS
jgi:hypothetical protein